MSDLDQRLKAHFAGIAPPADFDVRLAARLEAERDRALRVDRQTALRDALARHARHRAAQDRAWRRGLLRLGGLGGTALLLVLLTRNAWFALGERIAAEAVVSGATSPLLLALIIVPAVAALAFALRRPALR